MQPDEFRFVTLRSVFLFFFSFRAWRPASIREIERFTGSQNHFAFAQRALTASAKNCRENRTTNVGVSGTLGITRYKSLYTYRERGPTWLVQWQSWLVSGEMCTYLLLLFHWKTKRKQLKTTNLLSCSRFVRSIYFCEKY